MKEKWRLLISNTQGRKMINFRVYLFSFIGIIHVRLLTMFEIGNLITIDKYTRERASRIMHNIPFICVSLGIICDW